MAKLLNKIIEGNSLEILKTIPSKTFDLVFADPPYNLQIEKKNDSYGVSRVLLIKMLCIGLKFFL